MTNQVTIDKLLEMKLGAMSDAFIIQLSDPQMQDVPFEDRFGMLVDAEYTNRKNIVPTDPANYRSMREVRSGQELERMI